MFSLEGVTLFRCNNVIGFTNSNEYGSEKDVPVIEKREYLVSVLGNSMLELESAINDYFEKEVREDVEPHVIKDLYKLMIYSNPDELKEAIVNVSGKLYVKSYKGKRILVTKKNKNSIIGELFHSQLLTNPIEHEMKLHKGVFTFDGNSMRLF